MPNLESVGLIPASWRMTEGQAVEFWAGDRLRALLLEAYPGDPIRIQFAATADMDALMVDVFDFPDIRSARAQFNIDLYDAAKLLDATVEEFFMVEHGWRSLTLRGAFAFTDALGWPLSALLRSDRKLRPLTNLFRIYRARRNIFGE